MSSQAARISHVSGGTVLLRDDSKVHGMKNSFLQTPVCTAQVTQAWRLVQRLARHQGPLEMSEKAESDTERHTHGFRAEITPSRKETQPNSVRIDEFGG